MPFSFNQCLKPLPHQAGSNRNMCFLALLTTQRITAEREGLQNKFTHGTSQRKSEYWTEQASDFYSHVVLAWIECDVCVAKILANLAFIWAYELNTALGQIKRRWACFVALGMLWFGLGHLTWDASC